MRRLARCEAFYSWLHRETRRLDLQKAQGADVGLVRRTGHSVGADLRARGECLVRKAGRGNRMVCGRRLTDQQVTLYIHDKPVQSTLIARGVGLLVGLMTRR